VISERSRAIRDPGGMISDHARVISDVVARVRSLGGSISFLAKAISQPGEDVRVLGAMISDVVAWIRSLSASISALALRVGARVLHRSCTVCLREDKKCESRSNAMGKRIQRRT